MFPEQGHWSRWSPEPIKPSDVHRPGSHPAQDVCSAPCPPPGSRVACKGSRLCGPATHRPPLPQQVRRSGPRAPAPSRPSHDPNGPFMLVPWGHPDFVSFPPGSAQPGPWAAWDLPRHLSPLSLLRPSDPEVLSSHVLQAGTSQLPLLPSPGLARGCLCLVSTPGAPALGQAAMCSTGRLTAFTHALRVPLPASHPVSSLKLERAQLRPSLGQRGAELGGPESAPLSDLTTANPPVPLCL